MGIPLLHPWANRLSQRRFTVAGREVVIDPEATPLRLDDQRAAHARPAQRGRGLGGPGHESTHTAPGSPRRFDFAAHDDLMAAFPFAHELVFEAELTGPTLTIATTVRATGDVAVPIAFGFHPYLRLPASLATTGQWRSRCASGWRSTPRCCPRASATVVQVAPGRLGSRTFDDAYVAPADGAPFALAGGGRRIELAFLSGYPYAQVFAPAEDDVIAFEPMTAPTNALSTGATRCASWRPATATARRSRSP